MQYIVHFVLFRCKCRKLFDGIIMSSDYRDLSPEGRLAYHINILYQFVACGMARQAAILYCRLLLAFKLV